jgi:sugar/nucleoside kinase (ribokinase family)
MALSKIAVVGELNVDLVADGLTEPPALGREILARGVKLTLGSASAIFACGVARLGHSVRFLSRVGDDYFGRFCLTSLRARGVSTRRVVRDPTAQTGLTISLSTARDRALVTHLGAIAGLSPADVPQDFFRGCKHLHLTSYFLQTSLRPAFAELMREAKRHGLTVSFDPNSDPANSWPDDVWATIEQTDILFVNETEAAQLTREPDAKTALSRLAGRASCVVVKLGPRGAVAQHGAERAFVEGFPVEASDTTGAGDSFAAGFVHGFTQGRDLRACLRYANACGALSATRAGGTEGQPNAAQLNDFLARFP